MVRRSFRVGLRIGLFAGVLLFFVKLVQSRRPRLERNLPEPFNVSGGVVPDKVPMPEAPVAGPPTPVPPVTPVESAVSGPATVSERDVEPTADRVTLPEPEPLAVEPEPEAVIEEIPEAVIEEIIVEELAPEPAVEPSPEPSPHGEALRAPAPVPEPERAVEQSELAPAPAPAKKAGKKAAKAPAKKAAGPTMWVEPVGNTCPPSHPVKAKLTSRLFHLPGMFAYDRTRPDRCYQDEASAVADGLTKAKR